MKLGKYLRPQSIHVDLKATDKWEAIDELLQPLADQGLLADAVKVRTDLVTREKKMSTGMEFGLALPHAKSDGAKELAVALGISKKGINFDSLDGGAAHVIFLVVSRRDTAGPHIQCLATIARLFTNETIRTGLAAVRTPMEALRLLVEA